MSHDSDIEVEYFSKTHCEKNMIETIRNEAVNRCNSEKSFFAVHVFQQFCSIFVVPFFFQVHKENLLVINTYTIT